MTDQIVTEEIAVEGVEPEPVPAQPAQPPAPEPVEKVDDPEPPGQTEQPEAPADAQPDPDNPPAASPEQPAARLVEFKGEDGTLDEERLERELAEQREVNKGYSALMNEHPAVQREVLRALKAKGQTLTAMQEAFIAQPDAVAKPAEPVKPALNEQQIEEEYIKLLSENKFYQAHKFLLDNQVTPHVEKRLADSRAEQQAADTKRQNEIVQQEGAKLLKTEMAELAKSYPTIVKADPKHPIGFRVVDQDVWASMQEISNGVRPPKGMKWLVEHALLDRGRLKLPTPKPAQTRASVSGAARVQARPEPPRRGVVIEEIAVE